MNSKFPSGPIRFFSGVAVLLLIGAGIYFARSDRPDVPVKSAPVKSAEPRSQTASLAARADSIPLRPLAVNLTHGNFQWTAEDGRDPSVIRQLAHNKFEAQRMMEENETIFRRQLVYRTRTMSAEAQHAIQSGEPIRELLVPGLDGQEFQVEVRNLEITDGGTNGTFSGHILGHPDSMVTLAFKGGREAFTVISMADNIFLHAEPREPGELIVKKVDPDKYGGLTKPCTVN